MTTVHQIEANRANAKRSTGPRSAAGKARSRMNALKHGLTAETLIIADEAGADFDDLRAALERRFEPRCILAAEFVERLAITLWRLRRVPRFEAAILRARQTQCAEIGRYRGLAGEAPPARLAGELGEALIHDSQHSDTFGKLGRHERMLMNTLDRTLQSLIELQLKEPSSLLAA